MQKLKGLESLGFEYPNTDPGLILNEWLDGGPTGGGNLNSGHQDSPHRDSSMQVARDLNFTGTQATENETSKGQDCSVYAVDVNSKVEDGQTELHVATRKGHIEMVKLLLEGGANVNKLDARGWSPKALAEQQGNRSIYDLLLRYENRKPDEHKVEIIGPEISDNIRNSQSKQGRQRGSDVLNSHSKKESIKLGSSTSSCPSDGEGIKLNKKRITIHMLFQNTSTSQRRHGKLIVLPDSIEELLRISGKPCLPSTENLKIVKPEYWENSYKSVSNIDKIH